MAEQENNSVFVKCYRCNVKPATIRYCDLRNENITKYCYTCDSDIEQKQTKQEKQNMKREIIPYNEMYANPKQSEVLNYQNQRLKQQNYSTNTIQSQNNKPKDIQKSDIKKNNKNELYAKNLYEYESPNKSQYVQRGYTVAVDYDRQMRNQRKQDIMNRISELDKQLSPERPQNTRHKQIKSEMIYAQEEQKKQKQEEKICEDLQSQYIEQLEQQNQSQKDEYEKEINRYEKVITQMKNDFQTFRKQAEEEQNRNKSSENVDNEKLKYEQIITKLKTLYENEVKKNQQLNDQNDQINQQYEARMEDYENLLNESNQKIIDLQRNQLNPNQTKKDDCEKQKLQQQLEKQESKIQERNTNTFINIVFNINEQKDEEIQKMEDFNQNKKKLIEQLQEEKEYFKILCKQQQEEKGQQENINKKMAEEVVTMKQLFEQIASGIGVNVKENLE